MYLTSLFHSLFVLWVFILIYSFTQLPNYLFLNQPTFRTTFLILLRRYIRYLRTLNLLHRQHIHQLIVPAAQSKLLTVFCDHVWVFEWAMQPAERVTLTR